MKTRFILALVFCFFIAAAFADAAILASDVTTFKIKPDQVFSVGDSAILSLHVVSTAGPINFSANVTLASGTTNLPSFDFTGTTGSCTLFTCTYDINWPFTISSLPVTYNIWIHDLTNPGTDTKKNVSTGTDADNDGYYSLATGGNDCNDANAAVHPGAAEVCGDGIDNDCTGGDAGCGGGGGGGGGGHSSGGAVSGGGSGSLTVSTFNCLNGSYTVMANDKLQFVYKDVNYTFLVKDVLPNSIVLKLYPIPSRDYTITEGASKSIDLDWNNLNDMNVKLDSIESLSTAKVSCQMSKEKAPEKKPILEPVQEVIENIKEGVLNIVSEVIPRSKASPVIGVVISLAIVVIGLLVYALVRRRKEDEYLD